MRVIVGIIAVVAASWATPVSAQGLNWFYCYAPNPETGIVYVSDIQKVGPISERAGYGGEFSKYLIARGKLLPGGQAYCVMKADARDIERGQHELTEICYECGSAKKFEPVVWPRGGKNVGQLLAAAETGKNVPPGNKTRPAPAPEPKKAPPAPAPKVAASPEPPEGVGVFMMGRGDRTDVVYSVNQENGQFLTRHRADLKGGKWTWILLNDRCRGWLSVAFASNGKERRYFVARGADDEGEASRKALSAAADYADRQEDNWDTGVLYSFENNYQHPGADFSDGFIPALKQEFTKRFVNFCGGSERLTAIGVRG